MDGHSVVVVPRRLRRVTRPASAVVVLVFIGIGASLGSGSSDGSGGLGNQLGMVGLGIVIALAVLLLGRPRIEADSRGLHIRNTVGQYDVGWALVRGIRFDDGARWAVLELPEDEEISLQALQAYDGARSTAALVELRRLWSQSEGQR